MLTSPSPSPTDVAIAMSGASNPVPPGCSLELSSSLDVPHPATSRTADAMTATPPARRRDQLLLRVVVTVMTPPTPRLRTVVDRDAMLCAPAQTHGCVAVVEHVHRRRLQVLLQRDESGSGLQVDDEARGSARVDHVSHGSL